MKTTSEFIAAAKVKGDLCVRLQRVADSTGLAVSDLVRQGLVRIVTEAEAVGSIACHPLPPAGVCLLGDASPVQTSTQFRSFEDMLDARMDAASATINRHRR